MTNRGAEPDVVAATLMLMIRLSGKIIDVFRGLDSALATFWRIVVFFFFQWLLEVLQQKESKAFSPLTAMQ